MMKNKAIALLVLLFVMFGLFPQSSYAATPISVIVNGKSVAMDTAPVVSEGRILVPVRAIGEAIGADVQWDEKTKTITLKKGDVINKLVLNNNTAYKTKYETGSTVTLDVAPTAIQGRTLVPLRYIAESFDIKVKWDSATQTAYVGPYDVAATGKYQGYQKLLNHEYEGLYDIYYQITGSGSVSSYNIKTEALAKQNLTEKLTVVLPDGTKETLTRAQWYKVFAEISSSSLGTDVLYKRYGDFYFQWYDLYNNPNPEHLAEVYINQKYFEAPKQEKQVRYYMWYDSEYIRREDVSYDTSELKIRGAILEVGPNKYESRTIVVGTLKLIDKDKKVIKTYTFDESFGYSDEKEGYIYFEKDGMRMQIDVKRYEISLSGQDLLKLKIIKGFE